MKCFAFACLVILSLNACQTAEQKADRMIARFGPVCEKLGAEIGTQEYRSCIVSLSHDRAARAAAMAAGSSAASAIQQNAMHPNYVGGQ